MNHFVVLGNIVYDSSPLEMLPSRDNRHQRTNLMLLLSIIV